jgi:hypothetical protein
MFDKMNSCLIKLTAIANLSVAGLCSARAQFRKDSSLLYEGVKDTTCYTFNVSFNFNGVPISARKVTRFKEDRQPNALVRTTSSERGVPVYFLSVLPGQKYWVRGTNNNEVWLNSASQLMFNPTAANYFGLYRGEAYFDIKQASRIVIHDKVGLWLLASSRMAVSCYDWDHNAQIKITILQGKAQLDIGATTETLEEGVQYCYSLAGAFISKAPFLEADVTAWVEDRYLFPSVDCTDFINRLGRWFGLQVVYQIKPPEKMYSILWNFHEPLSAVLDRLNNKLKKGWCYQNGGQLIVGERKK